MQVRFKHSTLGFSLIEILFSVTILGLGMLATFGMFNISIRARSMQSNRMAAQNLISSILNQTTQSILVDIPTGSKEKFWTTDYPSTGQPFDEGDTKVGRTTFHFKVFVTTVLTSSSGEGTLKRIKVKLTWWDKQKTGYGRLRSSSSVLVAQP